MYVMKCVLHRVQWDDSDSSYDESEITYTQSDFSNEKSDDDVHITKIRYCHYLTKTDVIGLLKFLKNKK
jgi:hypothetical protein